MVGRDSTRASTQATPGAGRAGAIHLLVPLGCAWMGRPSAAISAIIGRTAPSSPGSKPPGPPGLGVETGASWANLPGNSGSGLAFCGAGPCNTKQNWIGTTRGRVGYAFGAFMPYLTAGAAYGELPTQ